MTAPVPPKPPSRRGRFALLRYLRAFRHDILSANPERLYGAKLAEMRLPFLHSFIVNEAPLVRRVLVDEAADFPKSPRMAAGLEPLLGRGVFITNDDEWARQRRIIDPAFEKGRLRDALPGIWDAGVASVGRLRPMAHGQPFDIEGAMSHVTADVIFRTLFSIPIEDATAGSVYDAFRAYQRTQPLLNLGAFLRLPRWMPRLHRRQTTTNADRIRALIRDLVAARAALIAQGRAPDDLATKIMVMRDPETGQGFDIDEMVDQVAVFFLAGHETTASVLAWALYLLAIDPETQAAVADESRATLADGRLPDLSDVSALTLARDVFREALRLYPPVPMMVREARCPTRMRDRAVPAGAQLVVSPWYLGRHTALWDQPDAFCPARWRDPATRAAARDGYLPFSTGPRVCPGAGFAMIEGPLILSLIARAFVIEPDPARPPVPAAQLTVRPRDGMWLTLRPRDLPAPAHV